MSIAVGIRSYFLANDDVVTAIGAKFFPHEANHGATFPYVVYRLHEFAQSRTLIGEPGKRKWVYEFACCGETYEQAEATRDTIEAAVSGAVTASLDGTLCSFFWSPDSKHDAHASAVDKSRFQMLIDLEILER